MSHRYTPEQHAFLQENAPGRRVNELHQLFVDRFGIQISLVAIKSYLSNHHIQTGTYRKYTQEHIDFIAENIHGTRFPALTEMFNKRFGMSISTNAMVSLADKHGLHNGIDSRFNTGWQPTQFRKGHVPANKGKKGIHLSPATEFKKGNMPQTWKPVGTESLRADGYIWVKIAEPHTWREKHRLVWEAANGPVPKGHKVIFGDGNRLNTKLDNLILVTDAQLVRMNQNGLIGCSVHLTKAGILVADIMAKAAERKKVGKKKSYKPKKPDAQVGAGSNTKVRSLVKTVKEILYAAYLVRGIDLRDDTPFEDICVIETPAGPLSEAAEVRTIWPIYGQLGYQVQKVELISNDTVTVDLMEVFNKRQNAVATYQEAQPAVKEEDNKPQVEQPSLGEAGPGEGPDQIQTDAAPGGTPAPEGREASQQEPPGQTDNDQDPKPGKGKGPRKGKAPGIWQKKTPEQPETDKDQRAFYKAEKDRILARLEECRGKQGVKYARLLSKAAGGKLSTEHILQMRAGCKFLMETWELLDAALDALEKQELAS
jgi:hypothetical protein